MSAAVDNAPTESSPELSVTQKAALMAEIVAAYVRVRWLLRTRDLRTTIAAVRASPQKHTGVDVLFAGRLGSIVDGRLRLLPGDTRCLTRSLVLLRLLARRGLAGTVVIGVRAAPSFGAHAWVELDGRALLQPIEPTGRRLVEL